MTLEKTIPHAQGNQSDDQINYNNDCANFEQDWLIKTVKMCLETGYTAIPKKKAQHIRMVNIISLMNSKSVKGIYSGYA